MHELTAVPFHWTLLSTNQLTLQWPF